MFYDIPRVRNMIAARQMDFIGKVVRGDWSQPAKRMITACCHNTRLAQRPHYHNKDSLVKNLKLLFAQVDDVEIDHQGSLKHWINEASDEQYWTSLVRCLIDRHAKLPERPEHWTRRRRSPRNHNNNSHEWAFPPTPPRHSSSSRNHSSSSQDSESQDSGPQDSHEQENSPPSPPRRSRVPPPRRERTSEENEDRDYLEENVGRYMYDSLKIFGLGLGASETEVKIKYRQLSRKYHPDKHDPSITGMTDSEAQHFMQLLNSAMSYLREAL